MSSLHSLPVLTFVAISCVTVTVMGLRIKSRNFNEQSTSQKVPMGRPNSNALTSFKNNSAPWAHKKSAVIFSNYPTKRQIQSPDVDNNDESLFDTFNDKPINEAFITKKEEAEAPSIRQVILEPNLANVVRLPHPYSFHPVHSFGPHLGPMRMPLHVHQYKSFPFPVMMPKYEHIPEPYYVPYKPKPDYNVMHLHVLDPVNPCMNGGLPLASRFGYHCLCSNDYHGRFCDAKLYCSSSPCQNGGVCEEIENNYQCQCKTGYLGYNCEEKNSCRPNPCKNDGQCVETSTRHRCYCRPGFLGKDCEDLDYCDPNPCQHGGTCQQRHGFHECICHEDYKGKLCEKKRICFSNPCKNGGKCVEDDPRFYCICPRGYSLPHCKVHVCESSPCLNGGKCVARKDGYHWTYHCICSLLYKGDKCEIPNPCVTNPCLHGGVCIDSYSKYTGFPKDWNMGYLHYYCACPPEFSGQKCEENLCRKCDMNAFCNHGRCVCNEGFRGDGFNCTAIKDPCIPNPCLSNGTCSKGPDGSFDCTCPEGYFPPLCTKPPDSCKPNPCKNHGICVTDGFDAFHCICPADFSPPDCANKTVDLCVPNPCHNKGTCQPSADKKSYTCNCKGLFKPPLCTCDCPKGNSARVPPILPQRCTESGDCYCPVHNGKTYSVTERGCEEARANPCGSNPCKNGGKCFPNQDKLSFTCQCPEQCTGDLCQNCDPNKICTPGYCKNGGTCIIVGTKPFCQCPPGHSPPDCVKNVTTENRHVCHPNPCQNGGTCRKVAAKRLECSCLLQFHGKYCERDKCMDCDVHANCHNGRCRCRRGYKGSGLKGECKQESVCDTCPLNAVCVDGECSCIKGFYFIDDTCKMIVGS